MRTGRRIFKNMLSLSVAEIANKGIALVTMIYLARVLQPDGFGLIGWAQAFVVYFVFIVDLGFNVVGPREIAKFPDKMKNLVNNILSIKVSLSFILYAVLVLLTIILDKPFETKIVVLIAGLNIFANAFLFNWVFQGIEKMEIIAIRQVLTSSLNMIGILIFVHSPDDVMLAISVTIGSMLLNSLWMLIYYIKKFGRIKFTFNFDEWKVLIYTSLPVALTIFITILYNNFSMFLLGILKTDADVGIYSAAFRVLAFTLVPSGILQSVFIPQLARSKTLEEKLKFTEKYTLFTFIVGSIVTAGFFTFSDYIIGVFGTKYEESTIILMYLMITGIIAYTNVSLSAPLLSWKYEKKVFWAMLSGGIVNIVLNFVLIPKYGPRGAAIAAIATELTVLVGLSIIMYSAIKRLYFINLIKVLTLAIASCYIGFYIMSYGIHAILSGLISFVVFTIVIFIFKIVTIDELRTYLKKD